MTPLKQLTDETKSNAANAKDLDLHPHQLKRWLDNDAHVDEDGNVYILTKGCIKR
ncbi:putative HTH-type transcriptional regulator [Pseudoalteromonas virus vB_PspP-H6/1]|nr:putative HTH-type transcriptional regulator [Pseudoalteromonas virus vB_PspP-H6/1]